MLKTIANNGPQFVASGGLNLSSNDNGCAQSAGNGCDLMQQQENQGTCRGHENPCSVNERQDVAIRQDDFLMINEQLVIPKRQALAPGPC